jgi:hypothetical protein
MSDVLEDDKLQFCHIQGYQPRVLCITVGRNRGTNGCGPDRQGFDWRQGYGPQHNQSSASGGRGSSTPHGRFARPDQRRHSFLPDKQCDACKRIGHEAINCNMLALALFIKHYKQSLLDSEHNKIE